MAQKVRFKTLCISKPSSAKQQREITKCAWTEKGNPDGNCLSFHLELNAAHGKISAQLHTIVKQVCVTMYCFCHCFLYPRTECTMYCGAVRKFYPAHLHCAEVEFNVRDGKLIQPFAKF